MSTIEIFEIFEILTKLRGTEIVKLFFLWAFRIRCRRGKVRYRNMFSKLCGKRIVACRLRYSDRKLH